MEINDGKTDNSADWFYPAWASKAAYNKPIIVKDTDSGFGRYSLRTKEIGIKDLAARNQECKKEECKYYVA
jgi:formylmethanofuran dehydrogenase subunit E